jgi:hypothetical protein
VPGREQLPPPRTVLPARELLAKLLDERGHID